MNKDAVEKNEEAAGLGGSGGEEGNQQWQIKTVNLPAGFAGDAFPRELSAPQTANAPALPTCLQTRAFPSCLCRALCISAQPIQTFWGRKSSVSLGGCGMRASAGKAARLPRPSPLPALTPRSRFSLLTRRLLRLQENASLGKIFAKRVSNILGSTN